MKTLNEFNLLSLPERDEIVTEHALFLINYVQGNTMCDVYKLFDFYVKISYAIDDDEEPTITAVGDLKLFRNLLPK